jgi:DNA-directed RNA polymerase specialized sigma24 family protein
VDDEDQQLIETVEDALAREIAKLTPRERLILKLRFDDDMKIADIARMLKEPAKPLYRTLHEIIQFLRNRLCQQGIEARDISRIVGHPTMTLGRVLQDVGELDDRSV